MKKVILILFLGLGFTVATAQNTDELKKHRFGIGLSTNLFSGDEEMNNFMLPNISTDLITDNFTHASFLEPGSSIFFSMFLSYQFHFSDYWYASVHTKLNQRSVRYYYMEASSFLVSRRMLQVELLDMEIPLMFNFSLPIFDCTNWNIGLGGGVNFNLSKNEPSYFGVNWGYNHDLGFKVIEIVSPFAKASTGFSFPVGKHFMEFFVSYTYYFNKMYQLYNNSNNEELYINSGIFNESITESRAEPFRENNIEIGLIFYL